MNRRRLALIGLLCAIVLAVPVTYVSYRMGLSPAASSGTAKVFSVAAGENAPTVATHLADAQLIRSRTAFLTYVNFHGLRPRLKKGEYSISPALSAGAIAELLAGGQTLTRRLVIPEGYRETQIAKEAASLGVDMPSFNAALKAPHTQAFLGNKPASVDLEGYLFPDSYDLSAGTSAQKLVNDMLDNFGKRVGPEYVQGFAAQGLNLHQGLTLASIIEREVSNPADRPVVAQIFYKRLKTNVPLGSDVTAQYASDLLGVKFDVNVDSRYNTRRYPGLPPGPICSPGLGALDAAVKPANTDYLFFLSGKDGKTYFAKTYAEHQRNIAKYL